MTFSKSLILAAALIATINESALCATVKSRNGHKVVLMSMDGFRYDYLSKTDTPNFDALIKSGARVPYVNNTFTTRTFPCHYTIVTGRFEESHGIVDNSMYDPLFDAKFSTGNVETRWWDGAEPIWINAVKAGLKVGVYFWAGGDAEVEGLRPTHWENYNKSVPFETRVDTLVTKWLSEEDFDFGVIYFDEPDSSGHWYGPEAPEMVPVIKRMDELLGYFGEKLENENLTDKVDFILTSDHGMTTIDQDKRLVVIRDYVNDTLLLEVISSGTIAQLRPQPGKAEELAQALSGIDNIKVYLKEDIPDRYHYKHHRRIMPVIVVADEGWFVMEHGKTPYNRKGDHGYDNTLMSMKPIFIASGPSFKKGVELDPIDSVDIYPLLCHLLDLDPAPNNGSFDRVKGLLHNVATPTTMSLCSMISFVSFTFLWSNM